MNKLLEAVGALLNKYGLSPAVSVLALIIGGGGSLKYKPP